MPPQANKKYKGLRKSLYWNKYQHGAVGIYHGLGKAIPDVTRLDPVSMQDIEDRYPGELEKSTIIN